MQGDTRNKARLSTTLSAIQRRNSEVSTVARQYDTTAASSEVDDHAYYTLPSEPVPQLYRSATVGRMFPPGKVRSVEGLTPPHTPGLLSIRSKSRSVGHLPAAGRGAASSSGGGGHTRTASLGRIVSPVQVDVATTSRRNSRRISTGADSARALQSNGNRSSGGSGGDSGGGSIGGRGSGGTGGIGGDGGGGSSSSSGEEGNSPVAEQAHRFPLPPRPLPPLPLSPKPQLTPGDADAGDNSNRLEVHRRLTTQTRSSCVLRSPRDTLALPHLRYAASVASSSPPNTPPVRVPDDDSDGVNYTMMDLPSARHSRSGSVSSDADAEVFGLKAVTREAGGAYMLANTTSGPTRSNYSGGGWLIMGEDSSSEQSREDLREPGLQQPPTMQPR